MATMEEIKARVARARASAQALQEKSNAKALRFGNDITQAAQDFNPVIRKEPTVATPARAVITKGAVNTQQQVPDIERKLEDIAIKKATKQPLSEDDLRTEYRANRAAMTPEQYLSMTPEEQANYKREAYYQSAQDQANLLKGGYEAQQGILGNRSNDLLARQEEERAKIKEQNKSLLGDFTQRQQKQSQQAVSDVQAAGQEAQTGIKNMMARRGFGRSSATATQLQKTSANTQKLVQNIEDQTGQAIKDYQFELLDRLDQKLQKYEDRLMQTQDKQDELKLNEVQAQIKLANDLYSQSPDNPQSIVKAAEEMAAQKTKETKELRDEARKNFEFMITNFGSSFLQNMSPEARRNYASHIGVSPDMLAGVGKTIKEQNQEWDKLKYFDNQQFETNKMLANQQFDLQKLYEKASTDQDLARFKSELENDKTTKKWSSLLGLGGKSVAGIGSNGIAFNEPVPHPDGDVPVIAVNSALATAYPTGHRFSKTDGSGGMGGQCKWFSEMLTRLNGKKWTIGSTAAETKKNLANYVKKGEAYYPGQEQPQIGQTIITNDSKKYWHSAVINAITPDGKLVLSESNYKGPLTVSNSRVVDPNDPSIQGILKTEPANKFKVPSKLSSMLGSFMDKVTSPIQQGITRGIERVGNNIQQQEYQAQIEANKPENIIANNPFLTGIAAGTTKLTLQDKQEIAQVDPQAYELVQYAELMAKQAGGGEEKTMTQSQADAATYGARIKESSGIIAQLEPDITSAGAINMAYQRTIPSFMKSDKQRQLEQAQRNFINAILRRESGAAIAESEFESADKQYFPQPGDDAGTLAQKKANRELALQGMLLGTTKRGQDFVMSRGLDISQSTIMPQGFESTYNQL